MNVKDFQFVEVKRDNGHEDYWFKVSGETRSFLTNLYMEQSMIAVTEVVYSKDEDVVGIKRLFPFNFDVVLTANEDVKSFIKNDVMNAIEKQQG